MKTYKENITIVRNVKDDMMIYVQAMSLQEKVLHWVKDCAGKWKPFDIQWVSWFEHISRPIKNYPSSNVYLRWVKRSELPKFFLMCDMAGIEVRCRMQRQGKFTTDEFKLIKEHCKMVEWS